jgi:superfamily II DNA or RNA helicase
MKFTAKSFDCAYISNNLWLPKSQINVQAIKQALEVYPTTNNPAYASAVVRLWKESPHHLIVPKFFITEDKFSRYKFPFVDLSPALFPKVSITHRVKPRDDSQAKAIQALQGAHRGILNLACGKGKTVIALTALASLQTPALVIVHNKSLMQQWSDMISRHLDYKDKIGLVQQDSFDWKHPITLAMIQTLASREWPAEFRRYFGVVIYDEVHHLSAPTFVRTADLCFGRRWGLTATPARPDGLETVYFYHLGQVLYSDMEQDLKPETWFIQTGIRPKDRFEEQAFKDTSGQENISKIRSWLVQNTARNAIILDEIKKARKSGRRILALTHSRMHAQYLQEHTEGAGLAMGGMSPTECLKAFRTKDVVYATAQYSKEALDAPSLDTLFILTPFGDHNALQQSIGRIQRSQEGKKQVMCIVLEDEIGFCHALCGKNRQYLDSQDYPHKRIRRAQ